MAFHRIILGGLFLLLGAGCTTSKWAIIDENAINPTESPEVISEKELLVVDEMPTVEHPVLKLVPYRIIETEYAERVKIQRTVQEYRPKWGFAILAVAGSALSFTAANTDLFLSGQSTTQRVALNATGALLGVLTFTNLRETGEPIPTDETRYLRQTGVDFRADTVFVQQPINQTAAITVIHNGEEIFHDSSVLLLNNAVEINVAALASEFTNSLDSDSQFVVRADFKGERTIVSIPVLTFMEQHFVIQSAIAQLRSSPSISSGNIITELGEGSTLKWIEEVDDQWVKVEYDSRDAFVQNNTGIKQMRSTEEGGPAVLVELEDIPFGEIDVENSLPILKSNYPADRAFIFSANRENQAGYRQFAERGEQLFRHYMRTSLRMAEGQVKEINDPDLQSWLPNLQECREMNNGSAIVYLTGFAKEITTDGEDVLAVYHADETGEENVLPLRDIFEKLSECTAEKLFLFVDLEYIYKAEEGGYAYLGNANNGHQQQLANNLLGDFPNAFIVFGNRLGQRSSIYSGNVGVNKRHHIFPYFVAQALQQRKTRMSELYRHLENNVDYTSRRLHDRPQEVQGFGNFMLDIAE